MNRLQKSQINPKTLPFSMQIEALKGDLCFGEAAQALGVRGSSGRGWQCGVCHAPEAVQERVDGQGGRCRACGKGYDVLTLAQAVLRCAPRAGFVALERILSEKQARATGKRQAGLFDD